jgi:biotin/methionine sulfoxide reductase
MAHEQHPHASHWGAFHAKTENKEVVAMHPYAADPEPADILQNIPGSLPHPARVTSPMVRAGWLDNGRGSSRKPGDEQGLRSRLTPYTFC